MAVGTRVLIIAIIFATVVEGVDTHVGDKVIFSKYGGTELKYEGQEYLVLSARDVLAVIVH